MLTITCHIGEDFEYYNTITGFHTRADGADSFNFGDIITVDYYYNYHNGDVTKTASTYKKLLELNNCDPTLFVNDII